MELTRRICALIYAIGGKFSHLSRNLAIKCVKCVRISAKNALGMGNFGGKSNMWSRSVRCCCDFHAHERERAEYVIENFITNSIVFKLNFDSKEFYSTNAFHSLLSWNLFFAHNWLERKINFSYIYQLDHLPLYFYGTCCFYDNSFRRV